MTVAELMNGLKDYLHEYPNCEDIDICVCDGELVIPMIDEESRIDEFSLGIPVEITRI